jgi:uncharacterized protein (TIGR02246 family)
LDDEQKVRKVVSDWLAATVVGDLEKIRSLVTEDVIFLSSASTSIRGRETFIDGQRDVFKHFRIDPKVDIQEVRVSGDMASCWTHLDILIIPVAGGASMKRSGYTLTVLRKNQAGEWQFWRDANLLDDAG